MLSDNMQHRGRFDSSIRSVLFQVAGTNKSGSQRVSDSKQPNVLIIMSDEHRPSVAGFAGDEVAETPNLDALASDGIAFANAHCAFPLCSPSRVAFLTGKHPHKTGAFTNYDYLKSDVATFAHAFAVAGYETVLAGRMHFQGPDQRHGFNQRIIGDLGKSAYRAMFDDGAPPPSSPELVGAYGDLHDAAGQNVTGLTKSGVGATGIHAYDKEVARCAVEFVEQRPETADPFLLVVGFALPHPPYVAPAAEYARFAGRVPPPLPASPDPHPADADHRVSSGSAGMPDDDPAIDRVRTAYYAQCSMLDENIGRVLSALDNSTFGEDTIVVYTSDHGDQLGDRGMWWKNTFYQSSVGVPLVMRWTGRITPTKVPQNVSLVDVGPTLLDLAGIEPLPEASGHSFRCLIEGDPTLWADEVFAESRGLGQIGRYQRMVRRGRWKLSYFHGLEPQLFDMEDDPQELVDLAQDPRYASLRASLLRSILSDWDPEAIANGEDARWREMGLIDRWIRSSEIVEPDPPWSDETPENWVNTDPAV